jgi:YidC/Oxa1 family membrane protein insertase
MTPEQEQQQKIMKVMMVFMFPLVMYNAPCGLALYFICNSTLGIIESRYIRAHVNKLDLLAPRKKTLMGAAPGAPERKDGRLAKPGGKRAGFFQRLQEQMEAKRKEFERQRGRGPKRRG